MVCRLTNGELNILLDTELLMRLRDNLIKMYRVYVCNDTIKDSKGKIPTEQEMLQAVNDLYNTALLLFQSNAVQIFDYLPLTKQGCFSKAKNILLKTSYINSVFNKDYYSNDRMQLRLIPQDEYNAHISLNMFPMKTGEQAILDANNNLIRTTVKRNSYIKEHQVGHIYKDAKDNKYLFLGKFNVLDNQVLFVEGGGRKFKDKNDFLMWINHTEESLMHKESRFRYIKVTKKVEKFISESRNITDLLNKILNTSPFNFSWDDSIKKLKEPLKVVEDCGQAINPELDFLWFSKDFNLNEQKPTYGSPIATYQCLIIPTK